MKQRVLVWFLLASASAAVTQGALWEIGKADGNTSKFFLGPKG